MAGTASARVTVNVGGGGLQPPPQAAAQGLTSLVFNEDFNSLSGIDMTDSRVAGFNWYRFRPFGYPVLGTNEFSVSGSVLTISQTGGSFSNNGLGSTCGVGNNQFVGFAAQNGAYFEASIASPASGNNDGCPAFWSTGSDHMWQGINANSWETDFYEKVPVGTTNRYTFGAHDFRTPDIQSNRLDYIVTVPAGFDFNQFHTWGMLWQPGNRWVTYRDDVAVGTFPYSSLPWLSGGDGKAWPIILGTGKAFPMHVDWVRVWQAPT
jgi:hypothetical protein